MGYCFSESFRFVYHQRHMESVSIPSTIRSIRYCVLRNSISALLWHSHTITLYPKGNNVDSIDEIIEVQNVESSIGSRMATENDLALLQFL